MAVNTDPDFKDFTTDLTENDIPWAGGKALFSWWNGARGTRKFPARRDFAPMDMPSFLPTVVLTDVGGRLPTYPIRLVGTGIVKVMGYDPTGLMLGNLPATDTLRARYDWVLENKKPYMCINLPCKWAQKDFIKYSTLVLPLGPDDSEVTMLIASLVFGALPAQ